MSETVTLTSGATGTIYGTFAGATAHMTVRLGDRYTAWLALTADNQKRALVSAADYLNQQTWIAGYTTFVARDAVAAFVTASYELAALGAEDAAVFTTLDQSSNIESVGAGTARVSYFDPSTIRSTINVFPSAVHRLVGAFLYVAATGPDGGGGQSGSCVNPFADLSDYDRSAP